MHPLSPQRPTRTHPYMQSAASQSTPSLGRFPAHLILPPLPSPSRQPSTPQKSGFSKIIHSLGFGKKRDRIQSPLEKANAKVVSKATIARPGIVVSPPMMDPSPRNSSRYELPRTVDSSPQHQSAHKHEEHTVYVNPGSPALLSGSSTMEQPYFTRSAPQSPVTAHESFGFSSVPFNQTTFIIPSATTSKQRTPLEEPKVTSPVIPRLEAGRPKSYDSDEDRTFWKNKTGRAATPADDDVRSSVDTWGDMNFADGEIVGNASVGSRPPRGMSPLAVAAAHPTASSMFTNAFGMETEEEDAAAGDVDEPRHVGRGFSAHRRAILARRASVASLPTISTRVRRPPPGALPPIPIATAKSNAKLSTSAVHGKNGKLELPTFSFVGQVGMSMEDVFAELEERMGMTAEEVQERSSMLLRESSLVELEKLGGLPRWSSSGTLDSDQTSKPPSPRSECKAFTPTLKAPQPELFVLPPTPILGGGERVDHRVAQMPVFFHGEDEAGSKLTGENGFCTPPLTPSSSESSLPSSVSGDSFRSDLGLGVSSSSSVTTMASSVEDCDAFSSMWDMLRKAKQGHDNDMKDVDIRQAIRCNSVYGGTVGDEGSRFHSGDEEDVYGEMDFQIRRISKPLCSPVRAALVQHPRRLVVVEQSGVIDDTESGDVGQSMLSSNEMSMFPTPPPSRVRCNDTSLMKGWQSRGRQVDESVIAQLIRHRSEAMTKEKGCFDDFEDADEVEEFKSVGMAM